MKWDINGIMDIATGYWGSAVLSAAVELGVFDAVDGNGASAEETAKRIGAPERHTTQLLDALAALGLLEKKGECYRIRSDAADLLSRSSPMCILDALSFNIDLYPLWGRLGACVKEGRTALPPSSHLGMDTARTRRFVLGMHSRALPMASALLPALDMSAHKKMLDVAAGPGTFSKALAERYPNLNVTLFDLPPVLAIARELLAGSPVAARIAYAEGDYHKDQLPKGFDAVLLCGAIHQESPESAETVLQKISDALTPGGELFVVDMMVNSQKTKPAFSALFSINMMLTSPAGRVFADSEISRLLGKVGFEAPVCDRPANCPYWIVKAKRP